MERGNIIFALICGGCAMLFLGIALVVSLRRKPMRFWKAEDEQPSISNVQAYNRANAMLWLIYGIIFIISGALGLAGALQIGGLLAGVGCIPGLFLLFYAFSRVEKKYSGGGES